MSKIKTWRKEFDDMFGKFYLDNKIIDKEGRQIVGSDDIKQFISTHRKKIKADLIKIADAGEYEDLRREVEEYFKD